MNVSGQEFRSEIGSDTMISDEEILTITELSVHLRVHPTTIYRLLREGRIPGFRVGSAWRFSRSAIERWEHSQHLPVEDGSTTRVSQPARRSKARKPKKK
jgi:excisionase family DNA binding protein